MSIATASMVLLWLVVLLIAAALAGLLREVRALQAGGARPIPRSPNADSPPTALLPKNGTQFSAVLLITKGCPVCEAATATFTELAEQHSPILTSLLLGDYDVQTASATVSVVDDLNLHARFFPGWAPALMFVDARGTVVGFQPAGSEDAVRQGIAMAVEKSAQMDNSPAA